MGVMVGCNGSVVMRDWDGRVTVIGNSDDVNTLSGRTARQCHLELQQACGESALPYRTVARWVIAFNERRQNGADMYPPSHSSLSEAEAHADAALIDSYRR
ncbi:uncharacterized protein TNIN_212591 [Trichonephila inaurata madagascariensis]|uniref:Uncharacterized protein n=1 Tax=Trichonephila inaurata madagascariensis TaxID=2747483 RepID=A0A8X6Y7H8_9ARAC|nr:uncharacterized protein TNIN_212591 [Trichonephila inaurata madagascariensis]